MKSFKVYVVMVSVYYWLVALVLPLIYAVTEHVPIFGVYTIEWLSVTIFLYPFFGLISGTYYFSVKKIFQNKRRKNKLE